MRVYTLIFAVAFPSFGMSATCEELESSFSYYDNALLVLERKSASDDSTLRATTYQLAVSNILERQHMVLDIMIYQQCTAPKVPDFPVLGLVSSSN